jgi:hypothetical protein
MRVIVVAVIFMLVNKQALVRFGLNQQEHAVHGGGNQRNQQRLPGGEIRPGSAMGKTSTIIASGKRAMILFKAEQIHILGGEFTPAQQQRKTDQTAGDDHNDGVERITHQVGAASPVAINAEIRLTSRITTDRLKIREP